MIGYLHGRVCHRQPPSLILDVGGVGYELSVTASVSEMAVSNENIEIFVHHSQREDGQYLYGFADYAQRELFRDLIRVSGIGPKTALIILSGMSNEQFVQVISQGDSAALMTIPGIGKKTAERLLVELGDRIRRHDIATLTTGTTDASNAPAHHKNVHDAVLALMALGYREPEAARLIGAVSEGEHSTEALIRLALQQTFREKR